MSPPTWSWDDPGTLIAPLATASPRMARVPLPDTVSAAPGFPPQPAWSRAATVGEYSRLLTPPEAATAIVGEEPLVRIWPNWSARERLAVRRNLLPCAPAADTTCVSIVPSE